MKDFNAKKYIENIVNQIQAEEELRLIEEKNKAREQILWKIKLNLIAGLYLTFQAMKFVVIGILILFGILWVLNTGPAMGPFNSW